MDALPKLGIDFISIGLYLINIGVLVAVLTWFVYKPLLKILDERQKLIVGNITEADMLKNEFQKRSKEMQQEKEEASQLMQKQLKEAQTELEKKHQSLLEEMENERTLMLQQAREQIEKEKNNILKLAEEETVKTIQKIVFHVLKNKVPNDVVVSSVQEAWENRSL